MSHKAKEWYQFPPTALFLSTKFRSKKPTSACQNSCSKNIKTEDLIPRRLFFVWVAASYAIIWHLFFFSNIIPWCLFFGQQLLKSLWQSQGGERIVFRVDIQSINILFWLPLIVHGTHDILSWQIYLYLQISTIILLSVWH